MSTFKVSDEPGNSRGSAPVKSRLLSRFTGRWAALPRWLRRATVGLAGIVLLSVAGQTACNTWTAIRPPKGVVLPNQPLRIEGTLARVGNAYARRRGQIWEVGLAGGAVERGAAISTLLHGPMVEDEGAMYEAFKQAVPFSLARGLLISLGRLKFRHVDKQIPEDLRYELAGIAGAFAPDPFRSVMPTYHRFVFLYTVYDMALFFEKSPLIGCTTFLVGREKDSTGGAKEAVPEHAYLARNFDFEAGEVFDKDKVVYLVREPNRIPFASVGWPGFVGVVSGINREGVAMVVHGGRGGEPKAEGIPVVFSLREALATAHTTEEAIRILTAQDVMVSHLVIVQDAKGDHAIVERAPNRPAHVRRGRGRQAVTNHFEGPLADDPKNREVCTHTSTLQRRSRADAILSGLVKEPSAADLVSLLRDRKDPSGSDLPLGDRRAIDALIATHGVVFDTTARVLWVSEYPHVLGRFVKFDLQKLLADGFDPAREADVNVEVVPQDPLLRDGRYELRRLAKPAN